MYRLIKISRFTLKNTPKVSLQIPSSRQVCNFCGHMGSFSRRKEREDSNVSSIILTSRPQSTVINIAILNELRKRRKFKKHKKKFAELLEVHSNSSTETKATVKKLMPEQINLLANSPNVTLERLHELKNDKPKLKIQKSQLSTFASSIINKNELTAEDDLNVIKQSDHIDIRTNEIFEEISDMQDEVNNGVHLNNLLDTLHLENPEVQKRLLDEINSDIENLHSIVSPAIIVQKDPIIHKNSINKTTKEKLAKEKQSQLDKGGKEKSFNITLLAYLTLCESCGYLNRGMATLIHYINRNLYRNGTKVTDARIFQVLMQGYASKGNVNKVEELWNLMKSINIQPTPQIYVSRLECIHRKYEPDELLKKKELSETIANMERDGISLNDLFTKCIFIGNQRQVILESVLLVEPSFQPVIPPPDICYSCSLLQHLNNDRKKSLNSTVEGIVTKAQLHSFNQEQLHMELASLVKIKSIEKKPPPTESVLYYRKKIDEFREIWGEAIEKGFERDVNAMAITQHKMKKFKNISIYPYLKVLDIQQYKEIVLQELRKLAEGSETFSPSTNQLYHELGHQVRSRYIIKYKKTNGIMGKTQQLYSEYLDWFLDPNKKNDPRSLNAREEWQKLLHKHQEGPTINVDDHVWPITVLTGIGRFLYNIILRDIKIDVNVQRGNSKPHWLPAFYSVYRVSGHKSVEEIKPHPVLSRLYRQAVLDDLVFNVSELPMLTPPVPWTSPTSGGNLLVKTDFIRLPSSASLQLERLKTASPEQLYPSFDSLNQLASVPWKVNQPVLDVVIDVFNNGGDVKLDIPQPPSVCPLPQPITTDMTKLERFEAYRQRMLLRRRKAEMYSLWCDALYRLSLAQHFRDRIFWLPHNMDFRGRVYPCPPHLNHLGADMARSLLCFARGEPLGPEGLNWLKIHLVNLLGTKKRESIQGRLDYANEVLPDIIDSADNPLNGRKWWCESEEPWQTLACCKEIVAAMRHPAGFEKYVCHFPVHQDGSCNGLQHYAALGRDEAGGFSVNLLPAEVPQDVYSCVANIVERERAKDAESGNNIAKVLEGFVRRKVIKQTVMTTVYGVTRYGARLQIAKQLKDIDEFPKEHVWTASTYLVGKTFESIREMFTSTREIQDWFTECAKLIAQVCGQNVEYITPLGLPVVQPYSRSLKKIEIYTNTGKVQENFSLDKFERPNVMKQKNAFPPNFVHSLDSTHMMLTSLHCEQEGITFVSVHDCYWTHPSTVPIMNKICREQFVSLHSEPILQDLSKFFSEKYRYNDCEASKDQVMYKSKSKINTVLSDVPQRGDLQLEKVLDSVYFFS